MPKKLDKCVKKLMDEGYDKDAAYAICKKSLEMKLQEEFEKKKKILTGQLMGEKKKEVSEDL